MQIRRIKPAECLEAHRFVQMVVDETYAYIWRKGAPPIDATDWSPAWVADNGSSIIALLLTGHEWIEDLWIEANFRRKGLGAALLSKGEREIAERGFPLARLRVVASNEAAIAFYRQQGWTEVRRYQHSRLPIEMIDFNKQLS